MSNEQHPLDAGAIDAINLAQALRDVEAANARVLDLTKRLMESEHRRKQLEDEMERLRLAFPLMRSDPSPAVAPGLRRKVVRAAARAVKIVGKKAVGILEK